MQLIFPAIIIIHLVSAAFVGLCILRLFRYRRRYKLEESSYSMLMGFIKLEHVVAAYILTVSLFALFSVSFLIFLASK